MQIICEKNRIFAASLSEAKYEETLIIYPHGLGSIVASGAVVLLVVQAD